MTDISQQPFVIDASSQFPQSEKGPPTDEGFRMLLGALTNGGGRGLAVDDLAARYHDLNNGGNISTPLTRPHLQAAINEADSGLMTTSLIEALLGDTGQAVFTAQDGQQYAHDTPGGRTFKQLHGSDPEFWDKILNDSVKNLPRVSEPDFNNYRKNNPDMALQMDALRQLLTNRTGM